MGETRCCWWAQQQLIGISISLYFHRYVNNVIVLVRPKDVMVYARGKSMSKTTLRTSLLLTWFEDSPYSNQSFGKTISPTTDHEDQSMKISSFFNTHTKDIPWHELSQTSFYLPTLQVVVWLNQLAQGYPTRIPGERVVYRNKPSWSRTQHSG